MAPCFFLGGGEETSMGKMMLPRVDYYSDESDPDIAILRRRDGTVVAAFSARGFTAEGIVEAAKENYRALLEEHMHRTNQRPSGSEAPSCGPGLPRRRTRIGLRSG